MRVAHEKDMLHLVCAEDATAPAPVVMTLCGRQLAGVEVEDVEVSAALEGALCLQCKHLMARNAGPRDSA
jgi:hypothetical protein